MKKTTFFCDLCGKEIDVSRALIDHHNELKIKMKPKDGDGWENEKHQPFLDLCADCEKDIFETLQRRYNMGYGQGGKRC